METLPSETLKHILSFADELTRFILQRVSKSLSIVSSKHTIESAPYCAVHRRYPNILRYLVENGARLCKYTCYYIAKYGYLDILILAGPSICDWNADACASAARHGQLDTLIYLHENGYPWDGYISYCAAERRYLDILKYTHKNGCTWNESTCTGTAEGGHLEILQYLHKRECPWDKRVCHLATIEGYLDILVYALKHGCPWDRNSCIRAANDTGPRVRAYKIGRCRCSEGYTKIRDEPQSSKHHIIE